MTDHIIRGKKTNHRVIVKSKLVLERVAEGWGRSVPPVLTYGYCTMNGLGTTALWQWFLLCVKDDHDSEILNGVCGTVGWVGACYDLVMVVVVVWASISVRLEWMRFTQNPQILFFLPTYLGTSRFFHMLTKIVTWNIYFITD